jgi:ubiquinone/menaquinone biosynthesis C-methylase UbiE
MELAGLRTIPNRKALHWKYQADARSYDKLYGEEQKAKLSDLYDCGWRPGAKLLDLGCGTGLITSRLASRCDLAVGLDVSERMIRQGRRRNRVEFILGDVLRLPFRPDSFDTAVCFTSFHHFPQKNLTAYEGTRVVKTGSYVVFTLLREQAGRDSRILKRNKSLRLELEGKAGRDALFIFRRI